ncbi:hypothetical protein EVAR_44218_1 [Eumeta japonica]|uniref:Peptidase aspartic putative domain-containing protein n=1 Tax=Eumeta variegata TaxID=151549 RepID=A0A4C1W1H8_EUMVA|nr:hypothetical protein EVAR_44218_1 [Eumeta japonica]
MILKKLRIYLRIAPVELHGPKGKFKSQSTDSDIIKSCAHLRDMEDELSYREARPAVLIGQDNWYLIISQEIRQRNHKQLVASYTKLGWMLHG